jgi:TrmH family RNA methyltransferase
MKHIASRENAEFKALRRLVEQPGARRKAGAAVLEGVHLCQSWLDVHGAPDQAIVDARRADRPEIAALLSAVPDTRIRLLDAGLIDALETVPAGQGVLFVVPLPSPAMPPRIDENCMLLDRIQDPGNVGSILRTCAAAGIRRVFLSEDTAHAWAPKVLRSGQGAHFSLAIHENVDLLALADRLDVPMIATTLDRAESLHQALIPGAVAWVFGNEGQGVHPALQSRAARRVYIPQEAAAESLNVAAAAAVCLFEQRRQHLPAR